MKNRIVQLINSEGLTSSKFADTIGVQRSSISHILSGRNNPSLDFVQKILMSFPSIDPNWLISGMGNMYKSQDSPSLFQEPETSRTPLETQPNHPPKLNKETINIPRSNPEPVLEMSAFTSGKQIEKVVVFYTDKTFKEYNPS
ncbi:helix-turn-helix transcriptional regulator [Labilibaculum sp. K2S]|uniref:helix-turn-helix transcriptional regulator n=1 Tax=Labilibaculum sp. K2S TaxID=3056386 RepID=UPI0025A38F1C|nr:helix-turn-helix transcriptional regulator [Labilibaculum sp. K2S]MDM8158749.1 helix-turn-helix transcriptional regulator [Labilibaculum sp. K2S]